MSKLRAAIVLALSLHAASANAAVLRVLTYNIHHAEGKDGILDLNRIANVISAANPDLVSLQEVDNGVPRSGNVHQLNQLAQLTGMQGYFGKASNSGGGDVGNGVLVRNGIAIISTINHQLPNPGDADPPRRVIEMDLSLDGNASSTEFKFFATHLYHNSSSGRIASAHFINDLVAGSSVPSILAGDMNFNPGSTAFNVTSNQWTDLTNINNSGKNRDNQIDYIFYRSEPQWNVVTRSQFILNSTTNVASDHHPLLGVIELPDDPDWMLIWNVNSGVATSLSDGLATSNGNLGVGDFPANPWNSPYNTGAQQLIIGYNANATFSGAASRTIGSLRLGTNQANVAIAGRNGNGVMAASGSASLTASSSTVSSGDVIVGEGGFSGELRWDSSGTLEAQGRLRVGEGGSGTVNQSAGIVVAGNMPGSSKYIGIGVGAGSSGTYNLSGGFIRPGGGFTGSEFRQTLVGENGATGSLNVGDDIGFPNSAVFESNHDLIIGRDGGTGVLHVRNDGRVELRAGENSVEFVVGQSADGTVLHTGGTVATNDSIQIGSGDGGVGVYEISGGVLTSATDGNGAFQISQGGASGTLRVTGAGSVTHGADFHVAYDDGSGGAGRLEIVGSSANVQIGQLVSARIKSETLAWEADAGGVTPLVVVGAGSAATHVQIQHIDELTANDGSGSSLSGDGIALELDLSALTGSQALTLIDNRSTQAVSGFFENGATGSLYAEGAAILGTGFAGEVTISYVGSSGIGSAGNDVILNLVASAVENADFDSDGDVDGADFLAWQRNVGAVSGADLENGDANADGAVNGEDLDIWTGQFGTPSVVAHAPVPEPRTLVLAFAAIAACVAKAGRRKVDQTSNRR